uniref:Uncharacterized protein n=1 Tax=Romanomermis culicivorax TaxID=13658 RepID=A0A915J6L3_ROMCU
GSTEVCAGIKTIDVGRNDTDTCFEQHIFLIKPYHNADGHMMIISHRKVQFDRCCFSNYSNIETALELWRFKTPPK